MVVQVLQEHLVQVVHQELAVAQELQELAEAQVQVVLRVLQELVV